MTTQPCLTRWGSEVPDWVCGANGPATPGQAVWIAAWFALLLAAVWFVGHARQRRRRTQRAAGLLPPLHRDSGQAFTWRQQWEDLDG